MIWLLAHVCIVTGCYLAILLRPNRQPEARMAWFVLILALPYAGAMAYLLFGSTSVGKQRIRRLRKVADLLPLQSGQEVPPPAAKEGVHAAVFRVGQTISGYGAVGGNRGKLLADSDAAIDELVRDINGAARHVHLLFYIWLTDRNGMRVMDACKRAAARGVSCRVMVDGLGSRELLRNRAWQEMQAAGVRTAIAMRIGNPLMRIFNGRIDLRNHRKIAVIDGQVTYCGSQNCADPAFHPKERFGPWVDVMMRFEGPVAQQNQHLFVQDWMAEVDEDLNGLLSEFPKAHDAGFSAQVVATGPTVRPGAMPEMFQSLMYSARRELFITTPYYVPNQAMQSALCTAARRGVDTTVIFPARNDDFAVGAASRSYYEDLLEAGVKISEYEKGLLHAKTLTVDGETLLIGSANMDRRSFDLNYENNILLRDSALTADLLERQRSFLALSRSVTLAEVRGWGAQKRLLYNTMALLGPLL